MKQKCPPPKLLLCPGNAKSVGCGEFTAETPSKWSSFIWPRKTFNCNLITATREEEEGKRNSSTAAAAWSRNQREKKGRTRTDQPTVSIRDQIVLVHGHTDWIELQSICIGMTRKQGQRREFSKCIRIKTNCVKISLLTVPPKCLTFFNSLIKCFWIKFHGRCTSTKGADWPGRNQRTECAEDEELPGAGKAAFKGPRVLCCDVNCLRMAIRAVKNRVPSKYGPAIQSSFMLIVDRGTSSTSTVPDTNKSLETLFLIIARWSVQWVGGWPIKRCYSMAGPCPLHWAI